MVHMSTSCSGLDSGFRVHTLHVAMRRLCTGIACLLHQQMLQFKGICGLSRQAASPALQWIYCLCTRSTDMRLLWHVQVIERKQLCS